MLPMLLVIDPLPETLTVSVRISGATVGRANVAVKLLAALMATVHAADPLDAPLQPANAKPDDGLAVRVTCLVLTNRVAHVEEQLMPEGVLTTEPEPAIATESSNDSGGVAPGGT